ncbi:MAG: CDP-glucose 4,6-dehydratase [Verrucomicrobia bacterium]|nr:CDP-glucose 4,6-dehydratase [Verrucomicrobiota bacterium]
MNFSTVYKNKRVWLSGHTGFKGAWLAEWLLQLGAEVHSYALEPATTPALFNQLNLALRLNHEVGDVRNFEQLQKSIISFEPDFVFHLAAQPLVRYGYQEPIETYETNVMGTLHVLEVMRELQKISSKRIAAVMVTTDKCYENLEDQTAYHEEHPLGGHDPYSSSKAMAEIATAAYRRSYFFNTSTVHVATARAGNVIGGGDWADDRIVPDAIRALEKNKPILVRNPSSVRPWQHVLEPLCGYLMLGAKLHKDRELAGAFNFGPDPKENYSVIDVVSEVLKHWSGSWKDVSDPTAPHEARHLNLSIKKAREVLGWHPVWNFEKTIERTVEWYRAYHEDPKSALATTRKQIAAYEADAEEVRNSPQRTQSGYATHKEHKKIFSIEKI